MRLLVVVAALASHAWGEPLVEPDEQAARRHFEAGLESYGREDYRGAIAEFEQARALHSLPAFDFNIGRCHERLEEWAAAADAYERYLTAAGDPELAARVRVLRRRARPRAAPPPEPAPPPAKNPFRLPAFLAGGLALGAGAVGTGLTLSVGSEYSSREAICRTMPCRVDDLRARLWGGYAMWAVGAAAAVVDVALIIRSARRR